MCLANVDFAMKFWKEENCYFGTGYKIFEGTVPPLNEWLEADGCYYSFRDENHLKNHGLYKGYGEHDAQLYPLGFHIFLKPEHAKNYSYGSREVYKVDFTDVLAFGTNKTYGNQQYEKCVIAKWMWIHPEPVM